MIQETIAIIGVGNMGSGIARSLLEKRLVQKKQLILSDQSHGAGTEFKSAAVVTSDNREAAKQADVILLAVKPQQMQAVLTEMKLVISDDTLIISIAAGIKIATIKQLLGKATPVVRVMPNLAATVGQSISAWIASKEVTGKQQELAKKILRGFGEELQVEKEETLDIVTAISGSGPAYLFYLTELLQQSAQQLGLSKELADKLARQTVIGSSALLHASDKPAEDLRAAVTSKGGTTEAAFTILQTEKFQSMFVRAIKKAYQRAKELSKY